MLPSDIRIPDRLHVIQLRANSVTSETLSLGGSVVNEISNDPDLIPDSEQYLATQQAVKAYVDINGGTLLNDHIDNDSDAHFGQDLKITASPSFEGVISSSGRFVPKEIYGGTWWKFYQIAEDTNDHLSLTAQTKDVDDNGLHIKTFTSASEIGGVITFEHDIDRGIAAHHPRLVGFTTTFGLRTLELSYPSATGFVGLGAQGDALYQTFKTYSGKALTKFQFETYTVAGNVTVTPQLYLGHGTGGSPVATGDPINYPGILGTAYRNYPLTAPYLLLPNTEYTFALRATLGSIYAYGNTINHYPDGIAGVESSGDYSPNYDFKFYLWSAPITPDIVDLYIRGQPEVLSKTYVFINNSLSVPIWEAEGSGTWPTGHPSGLDVYFDSDANDPNINKEMGTLTSHDTTDATDYNAAPVMIKGGLGIGKKIFGDVQTVSRLRIGSADSSNRRQLWYYGSNDPNPANEGGAYAGDGTVLRLGSMQADGDSLNVVSDGIFIYGINHLNDPVTAADYGYARMKADRFELVSSDTSTPYSTFRVDNSKIVWRPAGTATDIFETTAAGGKFNSSLEATGQLTTSDTTDSTSITTGALVVDGGAGIAKTLYLGIGLHLPTVGGTSSLLNFYETLEHSMTFTGPFVTDITTDICLKRLDGFVTICIPDILGTSDTAATISTSTTLPARFRPLALHRSLARIQKNVLIQVGEITITTAGVINAYSDLASAVFQNTGTNGFSTITFVYSV